MDKQTQPAKENPEASASNPTVMYIVCPICGYENAAESILCVKCQNVLQPATRKIGQQKVEEKSNLGTSEIEKKLYLHIQHVNETLELTLDQDAEFVVGRFDPMTGQKPAIDFGEFGAAERGVSRQHTKLILKDSALKIMDLGSSNSTFLNGSKLIPNQARILRDGDEVRLGQLLFTVQFGEAMKRL